MRALELTRKQQKNFLNWCPRTSNGGNQARVSTCIPVPEALDRVRSHPRAPFRKREAARYPGKKPSKAEHAGQKAELTGMGQVTALTPAKQKCLGIFFQRDGLSFVSVNGNETDCITKYRRR